MLVGDVVDGEGGEFFFYERDGGGVDGHCCLLEGVVMEREGFVAVAMGSLRVSHSLACLSLYMLMMRYGRIPTHYQPRCLQVPSIEGFDNRIPRRESYPSTMPNS